jgi:hypothetical protein
LDPSSGITLDDPYRAFSEWVRDGYGYLKCSLKTASFPSCQLAGEGANVTKGNIPFLEFVWADILRKVAAVAGAYSMTPAQQVTPFFALYPAARTAVKASIYSGVPGYYAGTSTPPGFEVDPATGCDEQQ